ncbi:hypothetical protein QAD02_017137 [Eretmocerus hayati]|uniref:Uncharacterized protein n=1 Tax=Eretmocerus hayati TaxID=131215 RepID=A0ACC2PD59_9HYME|nr:hypothetical protein QAD02_017137 [Eretmocerus hayati]
MNPNVGSKRKISSGEDNTRSGTSDDRVYSDFAQAIMKRDKDVIDLYQKVADNANNFAIRMQERAHKYKGTDSGDDYQVIADRTRLAAEQAKKNQKLYFDQLAKY